MNLTLMMSGKPIKFGKPFISGRIYREFLALKERGVDFNSPTPDELDEVVQMICESYSNQFTIDDFYNGLAIDIDSEDNFFIKIAEFIMLAQGLRPVNPYEKDDQSESGETEPPTPSDTVQES
ncbi:hypothetical protein A2U94_18130 [Bacillus sp. VT 712]|jgi:hypothetical protein|uniref:Uncharacterized protein n=2 Tax=Priestia TaxID=2800373 RepID=A0A0V8JRZ7_9BACI|nr:MULTISPECIES: hypothetical protein [Bacillaceae]KSU89810.1 hypothetical protein AS180_00120 [Priestia veravalensis]KZB90077.1 hypothetical protein A2U94_18130 [Bacillus sp. VT 712]MBN8249954.1 hypothetical protein [Priestia flexa]MBN8434723.1 hypothetical protein [Priestia flexa]MCA0967262.1 hypothetical protein [Priestia flexa]